eukprot:7096919-Prymnesium_polylepis.1
MWACPKLLCLDAVGDDRRLARCARRRRPLQQPLDTRGPAPRAAAHLRPQSAARRTTGRIRREPASERCRGSSHGGGGRGLAFVEGQKRRRRKRYRTWAHARRRGAEHICTPPPETYS